MLAPLVTSLVPLLPLFYGEVYKLKVFPAKSWCGVCNPRICRAQVVCCRAGIKSLYCLLLSIKCRKGEQKTPLNLFTEVTVCFSSHLKALVQISLCVWLMLACQVHAWGKWFPWCYPVHSSGVHPHPLAKSCLYLAAFPQLVIAAVSGPIPQSHPSCFPLWNPFCRGLALAYVPAAWCQGMTASALTGGRPLPGVMLLSRQALLKDVLFG